MKQFKNMSKKGLGLLAVTLLLSNDKQLGINTVEAYRLEHKLSESAEAWNSLHSHTHSHSHSHSHKKKDHKKKKAHHSKKKHEESE